MREFKAGDVVRVKPKFATAILAAGAIYTVEKADDCGVWLVDLRTTSGDLLTDWPYLPCRFELVNEAEVEAPLEGYGFRTVQGAEREGAHPLRPVMPSALYRCCHPPGTTAGRWPV